jgi:6-phosphogluconolactonase
MSRRLLEHMPSEPQVRIFASPEPLFHAAAEWFCLAGTNAIQARGRFTVALSGGSTPRGLYQELAANFRQRLDWQKVFFFFGDERHVPPSDPESNYRMADESLLSKLDIRPDHVFRIPAELPDAGQAARTYEETLRRFFPTASGAFPSLDAVLLGMGPDGHTASLFPGTTAMDERQHWVVANWVEKFSVFRITLTFPVLNSARAVMFLISGGEKSEMVRRALRDSGAGLPCQRVHPENGELIWFLDQPAAAKL